MLEGGARDLTISVFHSCTHFICTYAGRTHDFELATRLGAKTVGSKVLFRGCWRHNWPWSNLPFSIPQWLLSSRSRDRWMEEDEFLIREDAQPQATEALNVTDTSMMVSSPAAGAAVAKAAVATPESASGKTKPMRNSSLSTSGERKS